MEILSDQLWIFFNSRFSCHYFIMNKNIKSKTIVLNLIVKSSDRAYYNISTNTLIVYRRKRNAFLLWRYVFCDYYRDNIIFGKGTQLFIEKCDFFEF